MFSWLDCMQPVIYKSCDHDIIIAFSLRHELRQTYRGRYEYNLIKNLLTYWETPKGNQKTNVNILAP